MPACNQNATRLTFLLALAVGLTGLARADNPAQHADLAAALKIAGNRDGVLAELNNIEPFDESNVTKEYRLARFTRLLNLMRAEGGVCDDDGGAHSPNPVWVDADDALAASAYDHSLYLVEERKAIEAAGSPSAHSQTLTESPHFKGGSFSDRAEAAGYTGFANGENIAFGNGNDVAAEALTQWFKSRAGHCSGLFSRNMNGFGFGAVNYINEEFHNNNEFRATYVTGKK